LCPRCRPDSNEPGPVPQLSGSHLGLRVRPSCRHRQQRSIREGTPVISGEAEFYRSQHLPRIRPRATNDVALILWTDLWMLFSGKALGGKRCARPWPWASHVMFGWLVPLAATGFGKKLKLAADVFP
jgi:hypothetical protein